MRSKKRMLIALALTFIGALIFACSCKTENDTGGAEMPAKYDESNFKGSGIIGVPDIFDRVGYGAESYYTFSDDGSVALKNNFYAPLKNSRTDEGIIVETTLSRADGESSATQSPLTGAVYFYADITRYRVYVVGEKAEYSYLVINGIERSGGTTVNHERRYRIPLPAYKTGERITVKIVLVKGECDLTLTTEASRIYYKITEETPYEATSGFETSLSDFFGEGKKAVGLESLDVSAVFNDISFTLGNDAANGELDRQMLTVGVVNMSDGENSDVGGRVVVSEEKPARGSSVTVTVSIKSGYYLESLKINGENRKNRLVANKANNVETYSYDIGGIQTDTVVTAVFKSGEEKKYRVSGEYSYSSGKYDEASGKCLNDGDELSVSAGIYSGTACDGNFEIYLPDGEYFITLESEFFPSETETVTVCGDDVDNVDITFGKLKFSTEMRFNADDSVTFSANNSVRMIEGAVADEGFVFEYMVKGGVGSWFNTGGLYITYDDKATAGGKEVDVVNFDYIFVYNTSKQAEVVLIQQIKRSDNGPAYLTSYPYTDLRNPIKVTIAYYNGSYYFAFDDKYAIEINKSTELNTQQGTLDTQKFFGAKTRRLGLRNYDSAATFSSVSYKLGDAAAVAEIAAMKAKYALKTSDGGSAKFVEKGVTLSGNSCRKTIGKEMSVVIRPNNGKYVDEFTVDGVNKKSLLQGPYLEYDENGENAKRIYRYDFSVEKGGGGISVTFNDSEKTYAVKGSYSSENGNNKAIVYTDGGYTGTAENGLFSIKLPVGTHILIFESPDGLLATKKVTVDGERDYSGSIGEIKLSRVSLETGTGIEENNDGKYVMRYGSGNDFHYFIAGGERISVAGAFSVEFTMQNNASAAFYKSCAFFAQKGSTTNSLFILGQGKGALIALYDPNCGNNPDGSAFYTIDKAEYSETALTKVKIAYYKNAYYISFDGAAPIKISRKDMAKLLYADQISDEFFSCGIRTLGIRIKDTGATVGDINLRLGETNTLKAINAMSGK